MDDLEAPGPPTHRSTLRRAAEKAAYDTATLHSILDAGMVAHVGFVDPGGHPVVIPCAYGRVGDDLVLHGSIASRLMRTVRDARVCVTVTLLDGLVVARSAFESSMHYRSVVVLGVARAIVDVDEKARALDALTERLLPGRTREARPMSEAELRQTAVVALDLAEASAKVSDGWPDDPPEDRALPIWAGVVPLRTVWGTPVAAPDAHVGAMVPPSVRSLAEDDRFERRQ